MKYYRDEPLFSSTELAAFDCNRKAAYIRECNSGIINAVKLIYIRDTVEQLLITHDGDFCSAFNHGKSKDM